MKAILIRMSIRNGNIEVTTNHVVETKCKDINFAAEWFVSHFFGYGLRGVSNDTWFFDYDSIACRVEKVQEIDNDTATLLKNLLYY